MALIEFVEVLTPLIYAIWITAVQFIGSNRNYIKGWKDADMDDYWNAMSNLMILTIVELLSLILFVGILTRRHRFPILRQLHYALNQQCVLIVALMSAWSLVALLSRLDHCGNDYTLRFDY